jgi:hypothetical protein
MLRARCAARTKYSTSDGEAAATPRRASLGRRLASAPWTDQPRQPRAASRADARERAREGRAARFRVGLWCLGGEHMARTGPGAAAGVGHRAMLVGLLAAARRGRRGGGERIHGRGVFWAVSWRSGR